MSIVCGLSSTDRAEKCKDRHSNSLLVLLFVCCLLIHISPSQPYPLSGSTYAILVFLYLFTFDIMTPCIHMGIVIEVHYIRSEIKVESASVK